MIQFEVYKDEPEFIGPPCPEWCDDGPESHVWIFSYYGDAGGSILTEECPICERGANGWPSNDWPHMFLTLDALPVRLKSHTEVSGYYEPEYDHYVTMTP